MRWATVRHDLFWSPSGIVSVTFAPAQATDKAGPPSTKVVFENNTYIDNGTFSLATLQATTKSGQTDRVLPGKNGRPAEVYVFKRFNRYEPDRAHVALYN